MESDVDVHIRCSDPGRSIVDVGNDDALAHFDMADAANGLVLADGGDVGDQLFSDGAARRISSGRQRFGVSSAGFERDRRDGADEILELFILGDEVGFAVHFDGDTLGPRDGHAD